MPHPSARIFLLVLLSAGVATRGLRAHQTTATPATSQATSQAAPSGAPQAAPPKQAPVRRRRRYTPQPSTTPAQPAAAQRSRQRTADQRLLRQQEANRERMQQENDHQVSKVISDQMKQQAEPRIQSAPSYTPPAPLPGAPAADPEQRIQDAPGPVPAPQPTQTQPTQPTTQPQS